MTTPIPAQGAGRIRWHDHTSSSIIYAIAWTGYVGTIEEPAFKIYRPDELHARWLLSVRFATAGCEFFYADSDDELKERAERWLEEFVSSLGAVFPDRLREAVTAERDKRSKAALAVDPEWAAERHFGWADALDWVLALTGGTAPPSAGGGE